MEIINIKRGSNAGERCIPEKIKASVKFNDRAEPYSWIEIKTKPMEDILNQYEYWFDRYGNLCTEHGQIAPSHFPDLGHTFHVAKGCTWDTDSDWLRVMETKCAK